jgi:EAL domain-containing protein (putative c-di-GMP-specific phosphodiesterase class I)
MTVARRARPSSSATVSADAASHALAHVQFDKLLALPAVVPHFQPIVQLADGQCVGYEILGRSRLLGLETPAEMFRVAAERSLESDLSRVLRDEGLRIGRIVGADRALYVNTHPEELNDTVLFDSLEKLRSDNPHSAVVLEVHESAVTSIKFLGELRSRLSDLGIGLAYDDFGAGQARLIELSDVPPDIIKFDIQLVHGLSAASTERQRMVGTLVRMVRELGVIPLAEGIELPEEAAVCRQLGFELAQGYYFGRPAPIEHWLASDRTAERSEIRDQKSEVSKLRQYRRD